MKVSVHFVALSASLLLATQAFAEDAKPAKGKYISVGVESIANESKNEKYSGGATETLSQSQSSGNVGAARLELRTLSVGIPNQHGGLPTYGDVSVSVSGKKGNAGAGVSGHARVAAGLVGGESACNPYFGLIGSAEGAYYGKSSLSGSNSMKVGGGMEIGLTCKLPKGLTFMVGPTGKAVAFTGAADAVSLEGSALMRLSNDLFFIDAEAGGSGRLETPQEASSGSPLLRSETGHDTTRTFARVSANLNIPGTPVFVGADVSTSKIKDDVYQTWTPANAASYAEASEKKGVSNEKKDFSAGVRAGFAF